MAKNKLPEILTDKVTHVAQDKWIVELIQPDYELYGFFAHFQFLFGGMSKGKGIHLSQREISEHMGKSTRYIKYKLAELVELGVLSYARKSSHPRAGGVYFINISKAGEFDSKAQACVIKDSRVKPVETQAEEVFEQTADFAELCMNFAINVGKEFVNPAYGIEVRDRVYQALLNEDHGIKTLLNAVKVLKQEDIAITDTNWNWAVAHPSVLLPAQERAAMQAQQQLAGER